MARHMPSVCGWGMNTRETIHSCGQFENYYLFIYIKQVDRHFLSCKYVALMDGFPASIKTASSILSLRHIWGDLKVFYNICSLEGERSPFSRNDCTSANALNTCFSTSHFNHHLVVEKAGMDKIVLSFQENLVFGENVFSQDIQHSFVLPRKSSLCNIESF